MKTYFQYRNKCSLRVLKIKWINYFNGRVLDIDGFIDFYEFWYCMLIFAIILSFYIKNTQVQLTDVHTKLKAIPISNNKHRSIGKIFSLIILHTGYNLNGLCKWEGYLSPLEISNPNCTKSRFIKYIRW